MNAKNERPTYGQVLQREIDLLTIEVDELKRSIAIDQARLADLEDELADAQAALADAQAA
jgi:chaperonin cofactor prefoldin